MAPEPAGAAAGPTPVPADPADPADAVVPVEPVEPAEPVDPVVRTEGLTKRLRNGIMALDHLDLVVEPGRVVGLVGPNGSGKTVTIRMLLGLVRPTSGRALLFGQEVGPGVAALQRVGTLVDGPGFVPHLSGRRNLELAARQIELTGGRADIDRAIELCDLGEALDRPYSSYSHGMGYRLGLAQALLGAPDLVLLDEPTTGMDPAQLAEVHAAIAGCARVGATVVLSTHRMSEVEQVCTDAAVLSGGRLVAAGPVADLVGGNPKVLVTIDDGDRAVPALLRVPGVSSVVAIGPGALSIEGESLRPVELCEVLAGVGVVVSGFRVASFADSYQQILGGPAGEARSEPGEP